MQDFAEKVADANERADDIHHCGVGSSKAQHDADGGIENTQDKNGETGTDFISHITANDHGDDICSSNDAEYFAVNGGLPSEVSHIESNVCISCVKPCCEKDEETDHGPEAVGLYRLLESEAGAFFLRMRVHVCFGRPKHYGAFIGRIVADNEKHDHHCHEHQQTHITEACFIADGAEPVADDAGADGASEAADSHGDAEKSGVELTIPAVDKRAGSSG